MLRRHRVAQRPPKFIKVPAVDVCDRIKIRERQPNCETWIDRLGASAIGCLGEDRERQECEAGPGQSHCRHENEQRTFVKHLTRHIQEQHGLGAADV
ncbi:MAG TPA: hypothetical protein VGN68_00820 [Sphingopyxis sp.]|uniref:hypothetical protein n=1 Tax=Sphingopyxis sp. TaxID=1908224 RepID=UPI002E0DEE04|nr:hypothetical protein [Sphingopyxis sp.]